MYVCMHVGMYVSTSSIFKHMLYFICVWLHCFLLAGWRRSGGLGAVSVGIGAAGIWQKRSDSDCKRELCSDGVGSCTVDARSWI